MKALILSLIMQVWVPVQVPVVQTQPVRLVMSTVTMVPIQTPQYYIIQYPEMYSIVPYQEIKPPLWRIGRSWKRFWE